MTQIFIFYAMISELIKEQEIKLHGPFIHFKISEDHKNKYLFQQDEFNEEKRYLSKYLREKSSDKIPTFHKIDYDKAIQGININLSIMDFNSFKNFQYIDFLKQNNFYEKYCHFLNNKPDNIVTCCDFIKSINLVDQFMNHVNEEIKFEKIKRNAFTMAMEYFNKKYEIMSENYSICSKKKSRKN